MRNGKRLDVKSVRRDAGGGNRNGRAQTFLPVSLGHHLAEGIRGFRILVCGGSLQTRQHDSSHIDVRISRHADERVNGAGVS